MKKNSLIIICLKGSQGILGGNMYLMEGLKMQLHVIMTGKIFPKLICSFPKMVVSKAPPGRWRRAIFYIKSFMFQLTSSPLSPLGCGLSFNPGHPGKRTHPSALCRRWMQPGQHWLFVAAASQSHCSMSSSLFLAFPSPDAGCHSLRTS